MLLSVTPQLIRIILLKEYVASLSGPYIPYIRAIFFQHKAPDKYYFHCKSIVYDIFVFHKYCYSASQNNGIELL